MDPKKKVLVGVLLVALVGAGAAFYAMRKPAPTPAPANVNETQPPAEQPEPTGMQSKESTEQGLAYSQAVIKYADYRIQFDSNCQARPSSIAIKTGTNVMFDNRSAERRVFKIDGRSVTLDAYEYVILTMTAPTLPTTLQVDCGTSKNSAQILVQP